MTTKNKKSFTSGQVAAPTGNIIVVPDLDAVDLTALVEKELKLTGFNLDYREWDYYHGLDGSPISGRGKRFKWKLWTPGRRVTSEKVRKHFQNDGGFYGHVGAFIEWRRVCGLQGYHASIPDDNGCLRGAGCLYAPCSRFDGGDRMLDCDQLGDDEWYGPWSFVGFCELF